jgi:hypothetical protein
MPISRSNILMPTIETAGDRGVRNIFILRSNTVSVGNQIRTYYALGSA